MLALTCLWVCLHLIVSEGACTYLSLPSATGAVTKVKRSQLLQPASLAYRLVVQEVEFLPPPKLSKRPAAATKSDSATSDRQQRRMPCTCMIMIIVHHSELRLGLFTPRARTGHQISCIGGMQSLRPQRVAGVALLVYKG